MVVVPLFHEHRILTQVAGHHVNVIKALPPLTVSEQDLRHFATALASVLEDAEQRMFRNYASLGFSLGRRSLTAG
jgi:acetylornithine/succinyldiaminopimelate/putrescine aminotransferase